MNANPFLLLEATVAFYFESATPQRLWMGGHAERMTLTRDFKERLLYRPGDPFGAGYYDDESHEIEIDNLWLQSLGSGQMPAITRNQKLTLVIVWYDEEVQCFAKRTYYGVTARGQKTQGQIASGRSQSDGMQSLRFRAAYMAPEIAGLGGKPDLLPQDSGLVRYAGRDGWLNCYRLDYESGNFVDIAGESVVDIAVSTLGLLLQVNGQNVALANTESFSLAGEIITKGTILREPRMEFYARGQRQAIITESGKLSVGSIVQGAAAPDGALFNVMAGSWMPGMWLFSLMEGVLYAPSFIEGATLDEEPL
jgi:hypothetical protein